MKLVLFSDPHLTLGHRVGNFLPEDCLRNALDDVLRFHADADALLILGDLAEHGCEREYELLDECLRGFPISIHVLLGNHDDRMAFRKVFGGDGYVQERIYVNESIPCHLLDTLDPGRIGGSLDGGRLERFESQLAKERNPGFVFMHHHPIRTGVPVYDQDGLTERDAFEEVLRQRKQRVKAIFFGHCHLPMCGTVAGIPAICVRSLVFQSSPVFNDSQYLIDKVELPGYGLLMMKEGDIAFHSVRLNQSD